MKGTDVKEIHKNLKRFRGSINLVIEMSGYKRRMVQYVLTGERHNDDIVIAALKVWQECEKKSIEKKSIIQKMHAEIQSYSEAS